MARSNWFGIAMAALFCVSAQAQSSLSGRVGVTIMEPTKTISESSFSVSKLAIGGGSVSLSSDGRVFQAGRPSSAEASSATLVFRGVPRETIAIVLPSRVELRSTQGDLMTAGGFTSSMQTGALDRVGERRITMGTTFQVAQNQRPGTYSGHANILVAYN